MGHCGWTKLEFAIPESDSTDVVDVEMEEKRKNEKEEKEGEEEEGGGGGGAGDDDGDRNDFTTDAEVLRSVFRDSETHTPNKSIEDEVGDREDNAGNPNRHAQTSLAGTRDV